MGVVAEARPPAQNPAVRLFERILPALPLVAAVMYVFFVAFTALRHEPWADEAHSWLLARDASVIELWTRLMHYEGSPGLWQTVLHVLIGLGLPYSELNLVSSAIAASAAFLLLFRAPLPLVIRLALPFTYFLAYQYAVVARSYVLLPVLLFTCAVLWRDAERHRVWIAVVLCLVAAVSVHGFVISAAAWLGLMTRLRRRRLALTAVYGLAMAAIAWSAMPAADGVFVTNLDTSPRHFFEAGGKLLRGGFTGEIFTSALAVGLTLPMLWRGRGLLVFACAASGMWAIAGLIYAQVWHQGLPLVAWVFCLWIAAHRTRTDAAALAGLVIVIVPQCWWTVASAGYDARRVYSGSRDAAAWLRQASIPRDALFAIGYATTAVQPYFPRNIFGNVNQGREAAYWDWSSRNHVNRDVERLDTLRPGYVLVGYKGEFERRLWTDAVLRGGYTRVRHFEGNTFWKTAVLEPESYDLYERSDRRQ